MAGAFNKDSVAQAAKRTQRGYRDVARRRPTNGGCRRLIAPSPRAAPEAPAPAADGAFAAFPTASPVDVPSGGDCGGGCPL